MAFIVGLSGVDGSGKTTVARLVASRLRSQGHRVTYHHELDFIILVPLFNLLIRLVGRGKADKMKGYFLASSNQSHRFLADIYYFIVWLDNLIGYLYFKLKRGIVLHDRWPYDIPAIFEYRHYKNRLIEMLLLKFPKPDAIMLLTIPAELAMLRKKSDPSEWHQSLDFYQSIVRNVSLIAQKLHYDAVIDTTIPVEQVADTIMQIIATKKVSPIADVKS